MNRSRMQATLNTIDPERAGLSILSMMFSRRVSQQAARHRGPFLRGSRLHGGPAQSLRRSYYRGPWKVADSVNDLLTSRRGESARAGGRGGGGAGARAAETGEPGDWWRAAMGGAWARARARCEGQSKGRARGCLKKQQPIAGGRLPRCLGRRGMSAWHTDAPASGAYPITSIVISSRLIGASDALGLPRCPRPRPCPCSCPRSVAASQLLTPRDTGASTAYSPYRPILSAARLKSRAGGGRDGRSGKSCQKCSIISPHAVLCSHN